jgi:hypothetical protein
VVGFFARGEVLPLGLVSGFTKIKNRGSFLQISAPISQLIKAFNINQRHF